MRVAAGSGLPLQPHIESRILALREQRVMRDTDLAVLYDVQTKVLVQAVKRNIKRFPKDFMFQLATEEWATLRSQTVTSNTGRGGRRTAPREIGPLGGQGVTRSERPWGPHSPPGRPKGNRPPRGAGSYTQ